MIIIGPWQSERSELLLRHIVLLMTVFNFYLFNKEGQCIFYKEWRRDKQSGMPKSEEFKLMFGMLISLKSFAERLSTKDGNQSVNFFRTSTYKMNYLETATGLRLVLNSDPSANGMNELIRSVYQVFVETIMKNPMLHINEPIASDLFSSRVDDVVMRHSSFV